MENLKEQIALEIDKDRLRILIASFRSAPSKRLFARANVDMAWPAFFRAETLDRDNKITRYAGVISRSQFFERNRPRAALNNHSPATQPRHVGRTAEMKR